MAGAAIYMAAKKKNSLQEIHEKIHFIKGAEQISKREQTVHDVEIWTLVYEKYYFRTGGYASATIVLTEYGQEQTACVVASGGGEGLANNSLGANRNFAKACVRELETCGFIVVKSDLDIRDNGFLDRFFK